MMKRMLSILLVLVIALSTVSLTLFTVSAEEVAEVVATAVEATIDEASKDEAKLVISDIPNLDASEIDGTAIGYMGDINDDGKVNIKDVTLIQKHLAKIISLNEKFKALSDVDNNQKLNVRDATALQKYIAGFDVKTVILHLLYETGTHTHNYIETVFEVTCVKDGYTGYSCICGDEYKENVVEAKGHDYKIKRVDATCITDGYTVHTCKNCNHSYKDSETKATGVHSFEKGVCKICDFRECTTYIKTVKDYVIKNGEFDKENKIYTYELNSFNDYDLAFLSCQKDVDALVLSYAVYYEDGIDMVTIAFSAEDEDFGFYMICGGYFECAGSYNTGKYTQNVTNIPDAEFYFYVDGISEADALEYSLNYVDKALRLFNINSDLPASRQELGFSNY